MNNKKSWSNLTLYCTNVPCFQKSSKLELETEEDTYVVYTCPNCNSETYVSKLDGVTHEYNPEGLEECVYDRIASERAKFDDENSEDEIRENIESIVSKEDDEYTDTLEVIRNEEIDDFIQNHCTPDDDEDEIERYEDE